MSELANLLTPEVVSIQVKKLETALLPLRKTLENTPPGQSEFGALSSELTRKERNLSLLLRFLKVHEEREDLQPLLKDPELASAAEEENAKFQEEIDALSSKVAALLLPPSPHRNSNIYLELRPAAGGDEATIFCADLSRAYTRFAESLGNQVEVASAQSNALGGFKELVLYISGKDGAFEPFAFEGGTHRVQRVPKTETQGRVHTSTITVAILPEAPEAEAIALEKSDLKIDTYRASGAGGQHVNKTDSAVRITHIPSGIVVECQQERSQHKNKAKALALLAAKLGSLEEERNAQHRAQERRAQVGTGDRSERIRTYNYPQQRVTDHRINFTMHDLSDLMEGHLEPLVEALQAETLRRQLSEGA